MLPVLLPGCLALAALAAVLVLRRRRPAAPDAPAEPVPPPVTREVVVAAAVAPAPTISGPVAAPRPARSPLHALDELLAELESTTVRIDGADELGESAVAELEGLAARLEAAAAAFAA